MKYIIQSKIMNLILILIVVISFISIPSYIVYHNTKSLILDELGRNAMNIAYTISKFIQQDIDEYIELNNIKYYDKENYNKEYYEKMRKLFLDIKEETKANFIFTEKKISNDKIAYIIDGENLDSDYFSHIGSYDRLTEIEESVFNEGLILYGDMKEDPKWGHFLTGYAPIINPHTDEIIGLVGVDFSVDLMRDIIKGLRNFILIGGFILISIISIGYYKLLDMRSKALEKDFLTGLFSKYNYDKHLKDAIGNSKLKKQPLSLMMLDVDSFKEVNDNYGHLIGDEILKHVGNVIKTNTRYSDIYFRFGGDEFLIILPNTNIEQAMTVANRIQQRVESKITLSIGIALWEDGMTSEEFTQCADKAMYDSKNKGKNNITLYELQKNFGQV